MLESWKTIIYFLEKKNPLRITKQGTSISSESMHRVNLNYAIVVYHFKLS